MVNAQILATPRGIVKIVEVLFTIITFGTVADSSCLSYDFPFSSAFASSFIDRSNFIVAAGVIGFIFALITLVIYVFALDRMPAIFNKIEMVFSILWAFILLLAAALWAAKLSDVSSSICEVSKMRAGAAFGFLSMFTFIASAALIYKSDREGGDGSGFANQGAPVTV
eukprot:Opistho-2@36014